MERGIMWINFKEEATEEQTEQAITQFYLDNEDIISGTEYNVFKTDKEFEELRAYFRKWAKEIK